MTHAGERRADQPRHVDHGGVERDGVAEVALVFDHLDEEGLTAGHVEGVDEALQDAEREDLADGDALARVSAASASDCTAARACVQTRTVRRFQRSTQTPAKGASRKVGIWPAKPTMPSSQRGAGEPIDQPAGGEPGHPGADQGDALAGEEEAEVGCAERPPGMGDATGMVAGWRRVRRRRAACPAARQRAEVLPVRAARAAQMS